MSKRRRGSGVRKSAPRPIDKQLKGVVQTLSSAAQTVSTLITATFPCTIVGIRWDLSFRNAAGTVPTYEWAIIMVRDGLVAGTLSLSNNSDFYQPEQDVLAFGTGFAISSQMESKNTGHTKTMRKLMGGDQIQLVGISDTAAAVQLHGVVQFFCKG